MGAAALEHDTREVSGAEGGVVIVGIDEAGYGPMLGPLCIGMAAIRIGGWQEGDAAPDVWERLSKAICRRPRDKQGRLAIDDSKTLKLPAGGKRHQLTHLERSVLAWLAAAGKPVRDDAELLEVLGTSFEPHPWYARGGSDKAAAGRPLPLDESNGTYKFAANLLAATFAAAGVEPLDLRCVAVCETKYNEIFARSGKPATTEIGLLSHMRTAWVKWGHTGKGVATMRLVCDAQSGRIDYSGLLARFAALSGVGSASAEVIDQQAGDSRYRLSGIGPDGLPRAALLSFQTEGDARHLPIALASMTAKLVRELAMLRFNDFWLARAAHETGERNIKPTAGYWQDAQRFLAEIRPVLDERDRRVITRLG